MRGEWRVGVLAPPPMAAPAGPGLLLVMLPPPATPKPGKALLPGDGMFLLMNSAAAAAVGEGLMALLPVPLPPAPPPLGELK